ncbi:MAG TPA: nuclear transport factor 2 family protein [Plantibacter sp.]|uniref:nuclear transport factor 2 family protein n=1 Tax=unclassified Plantibacter TaxID=2624265 RepID=UPI002BD2C1CB|nr:nuclear transport factor 2 family protein [Plantibacter sp.]
MTSWINEYVRAGETNDRDDIAALFTEDAEYHESPFDTEWIGREGIIEGWRSRWDWQQGGWTFESTITSIHGLTAVVTGVGRYTELGDFDNVWTVTFDEFGRCTRFDMVNTERS